MRSIAKRIFVSKNCASSDHPWKLTTGETRSPPLRVESLDSPLGSIPGVDLADVEPARHSAPELDAPRSHEEARPVWRPRNRLAGKSLFSLGDAIVEVARTSHRLALSRRPRADLAPARARRKVGVGFGV